MAQYDIGIDLGTTTIIIAMEGKGVILNQPSVVAVDTRKDQVLAVGDDALAMVLAHGTKQPIGRMYLVCDVTVLALSLSYIPLFNILCSLASVTLSSWIIGRFTLPARGSLRPRAADA